MQVDENLRVEGFSNVFAVGDATNVKETKLGYLAAAQVTLTLPSGLVHVASELSLCLRASSLAQPPSGCFCCRLGSPRAT